MAAPNDASGLDLVWLGADAQGWLAAFVTAGEGPVPTAALPYALGEPDLESQLLLLPVRGSQVLLTTVPDPSSFIELSSRGLFVFDWTDVHRTLRDATQRYELVCRPLHPLSVEALPPALQIAARAALLEGVRFTEQTSVMLGLAG
jgi:hypothetical protein